MQEWFKKILQKAGIYHPLQSAYREFLFSQQLISNRKKYAPFRGRGYYCNVCHEKYEQFVPSYPAKENANALRRNHVIAGYGENVYCPNCMSTARERLVIGVTGDNFEIKNKKILHLSPEKNIYNFLQKDARVITADLEPGYYRNVDPRIQMKDITRLDFGDMYFDLIIANHVLEHIPNDRLAMKELYRVLIPGGRAVLQVPYSKKIPATIEDPAINDPQKQSGLFGQKDHVRIYLLDDYVQRLQSVGFIVTVRTYDQLEQYYVNAIQTDECFFDVSRPIS